MPVYSYLCKTCGQEFEASQRMSDAALTACTCGKDGEVTRQISAGSGLIFKGSGFYITDYKNKGSNGSSEPKASPSESNAGSNGCGAQKCCMADKPTT